MTPLLRLRLSAWLRVIAAVSPHPRVRSRVITWSLYGLFPRRARREWAWGLFVRRMAALRVAS